MENHDKRRAGAAVLCGSGSRGIVVNFRELSSVVATWVGLMAAIAGGYTTINGYLAQTSKQIDERKLQTFKMVQLYNGEEMVRIRAKILPLVRSNTFCRADQRASMQLDDNEAFAFVEFFDTLGLCLEFKLCDDSVAYTFFGAYANWHWPAMQSFINSVRIGEKDFGLERPYGYGLELLARKPMSQGKCGNG